MNRLLSLFRTQVYLAFSLILFQPILLKGGYYDSLYLKIEESTGLPQQKIYLAAYLSKAKEEKDFEEILNAYRYYIYYSPQRTAFEYADSMVWAAKMSKDSVLMAEAHLSKGILYYKYKEYRSALHFYLKAHGFLESAEDGYLFYKIRYNIAQVKSYLGNYEEAIELYKECIDYFRAENPMGYLNSLHALALCYSRIGDFSQSNHTIEYGLSESRRLSISDREAYFYQLKGINSSLVSDFYSAISLIEEGLPLIKERNDFANLAQSYFHLGKSHWALNDQVKAVHYFKKVDEIFNVHQYIHPDLRETYLYLNLYYRSLGYFDSIEYSFNQHIKAHSQYEKEFQFLSPVLSQRYDYSVTKLENLNLKKSIAQKEQVHKFLIYILGGILFCLVLILGVWGKAAVYLNKKDRAVQNKGNPVHSLNPQRLEVLRQQLDRFESTGKFLKKDWSQAQLAAEFDSNVAYLKEAIRQFRGKNFSTYINDLRIDHLLGLLEKEKRLWHYDNKSLAQEVGFSTTQRFTKAFKLRTGKTLSEYLRLMQKE